MVEPRTVPQQSLAHLFPKDLMSSEPKLKEIPIRRNDVVDEMVQYGFAQLDHIDGQTDLSIFQKDAITIRIAEPADSN
ncbi:46023_t:CDS:2 [Gigaspora margarita]|uniref:46023_t:CDS:1 n=1 Tax=Gigaspora margarita TaxID=4874 RepID=A0ABN7UFA2_GIGMA|nr:46023_t:CDS:2 [Gigaspora margarita]